MATELKREESTIRPFGRAWALRVERGGRGAQAPLLLAERLEALLQVLLELLALGAHRGEALLDVGEDLGDGVGGHGPDGTADDPSGMRTSVRIMAAARGSLGREALERLIAEDLTVRAIAARTGRSFTTVRYWLGRYGLRTTEAARRRVPAAGVVGSCESHGETRTVRVGGRDVCARCRADAVSAWRRRAKQQLVDEAGGACALCGYGRCVRALQFHHVDPAAKSFGLASRGLSRSIERLREEATKCVLLCANCHVEVEAGIATLPAELGGPPEGAHRPDAPIGGNSIGRMLDC